MRITATETLEVDMTVVASPPVLPSMAQRCSALVPVCSGPERARLHFRVGRLCALKALGMLFPGRTQTRLDRGRDRLPVWPRGATGSITHTDGFVSAAVAPTADVRTLGIDSERMLLRELEEGVAEKIATPAELALAARAAYSRLEALTLIFSAKESVFKCLFPLVGRFFDFDDIRFVHADASTNVFHAEIVNSLSPEFNRGRILTGRFELKATWVHTGVCLEA
jgi:enterobactin synthetase component D